jgi:Ca2+-binding EF-hand superfamily protein
MTLGKILATGLVAGGFLMGGAFVASVPAHAEKSAIKALDTDNDGTLDLDEVTKAAQAVFDRLNKDQDDTLDIKELGGRVKGKEFAAADPDNDKTLSKEEYLAVVTKLFKQADTEGDGKLDAKELSSKAGRALLRLIR